MKRLVIIFSVSNHEIEAFKMDFNLMITTRQVHQHFSMEKLVVDPYATLARITSGCILAVLQNCENLLLDTILKIHIAGVIWTKRVLVKPVRESRFPEIITDHKAVDVINRIDLKNFDHVKLIQHAGKGKKSDKKGGKKSGKGNSKEGNQNVEQEKLNQRKKDEEERLKKWNDDWDKKLNAQEALDDIPCCSAEGLFLKPKTQSNIWIKVTQDKRTQDVQMAFMHVPVPRPKAPPLPKLLKVEPVENSPPIPEKNKSAKKKGKGKKK